MTVHNRHEQLRAYAAAAGQRLVRAGQSLADRQVLRGATRGQVAPYAGCTDLDLHGSLAAVWIWARAQALAPGANFAENIRAAWEFAVAHWWRFVPPALEAAASDEAPYDCALTLRAALATGSAVPQALATEHLRLADGAARRLGAHLSGLEEPLGRAFADPGFLAWTLIDYARARADRGLLATARRFVERHYGMKAPPPLAEEPAPEDELFDFSCTTATRVLAVVAAEGSTPFVGAWLRERIAPALPHAVVPRPLDETCWNACIATLAGRAFLVSTDPRFLDVHARLIEELSRRADRAGGGVGRAEGFEAETLATFYYGLALDALTPGTGDR